MVRIGVGDVLSERWRIDAPLGKGGLGSVWAATHRAGGRVAIKVLHPEIAHDEGIKKRFIQEGRAANRVKHKGVVRVMDDDLLPDGTPILVMELLEGETLEARRLRLGGTLPLGEVMDYMTTLLDVLEVAHGAGVIHRDIKPENLFLEKNGTLRVLDFGIARILEGSNVSTATGAILGTFGYMPPEQAAGRVREIDGRTDLWAVGATAFVLLAGEPVHQADSVPELMVASMSRPARSLRDAAPGLPPDLVRVVDRALRSNQAERWSSAREMRDALGVFGGGPRNSPRIVELARDLGHDVTEPPATEPLGQVVTQKMVEPDAIANVRNQLAPLQPPPAPLAPGSNPGARPGSNPGMLLRAALEAQTPVSSANPFDATRLAPQTGPVMPTGPGLSRAPVSSPRPAAPKGGLVLILVSVVLVLVALGLALLLMRRIG